MAVRVIIQRWVRYGRESELRRALERMRVQACEQPGYISGETLRCPTDPSLWVVISTWETMADWQRWVKGPDRAEFESRIAHLIEAPTQVLVLESIAVDQATVPGAVESS
ncbi:MAG TPA: antibiotic biosynthesis monooxygenase family protein [archaeon]|nr:antibiotic biosynthesis monooxygenase family protein [archaeon]